MSAAPATLAVAPKRATAPLSRRGAFAKRILVLVAIVALARLMTLSMYPLADRTESRYGEIARVMVASGDWITPRFVDEPFWGKPPLSTWAQAGGIAIFGRNEFAVRFPAWLAVVLTGWLTWLMACRVADPKRAWIAVAVFACTPLVIAMAGCAMTDPYLTLGLTLSLFAVVSWCVDARHLTRTSWKTAVLFALGAAIGTLSKGPIAVVFAGTPLVALLVTPSGRRRLHGWPWVRAIAMFALLAVPWFVAAEMRTPGFLQYFLVGEHWQRFVDANWNGDRYGKPHARFPGTVWLYFAVGFLPWIPPLVRTAWAKRRTSALLPPAGLALVAALLAPLLLFTVARSLLLPYVYPAIPAACVLLCRTVRPRDAHRALRMAVTICVPALVVLALIPDRTWSGVSQQPVLEGGSYERLIYTHHIRHKYSARFYSDGVAVSSHDLSEMDWDRVRADLSRTHFVSQDRHFARVPDDIRAQLVEVRSVGRYQIWHAVPRRASAGD